MFSLFNAGCGTAEPERKTTTRPSNSVQAEPTGTPTSAPAREPSNYQEVMDETQRQMDEHAEEMDIAPSGSGGSCAVLQQCASGDDLCWQGRCWTKDQLFEDYEKCQNMNCNHLECPECEGNHEQCTIATSAGSSMYRVCVDCVRGTGCKEGFTCEMGRCV